MLYLSFVINIDKIKDTVGCSSLENMKQSVKHS